MHTQAMVQIRRLRVILVVLAMTLVVLQHQQQLLAESL